MARVLLVDTNVSSSPIYDYLCEQSHDVYVMGGNPNDFLAKSAKNYVNIDYSDIEQVIEQIEKLHIDYLVPGCNDLSYLTCAEINARRTFTGIESIRTTEIINDKALFRKFASEIGLPIPRTHAADQDINHRPVIVKPVDAFSGRGMTAIHDRDPAVLARAIEMAKAYSRKQACIVEDFITGQLYSHSAFLCDQEIVADFIVEEHGTANPFVVDTSRVVYEFPAPILDKVRLAVTRMAKALHLLDGLIHTQFLLAGDDFRLVEVTRRCPGDLYSQLIEKSTGYRYAEMYVRPFLGERISGRQSQGKQNWIIRHTVSQSTESHWSALNFNAPLKIAMYVSLAQAGDLIQPSPFSRIAIIFIQSSTVAEHNALYLAALARSLYEIQ